MIQNLYVITKIVIFAKDNNNNNNNQYIKNMPEIKRITIEESNKVQQLFDAGIILKPHLMEIADKRILGYKYIWDIIRRERYNAEVHQDLLELVQKVDTKAQAA